MASIFKQVWGNSVTGFRIFGVLSMVLALCLVNKANADLTIGFKKVGEASFADTYLVTTGDSLAIEIFLRESGTSILQSPGWAGFEFVGTPSALFGSFGSFAINGDFGITSQDSTPTKLDMTGGDLGGVTTVNPFLLLGSFTFNSTGDGATVINFADRLPGSDTWVDGGAIAHDSEIFGINQTNSYALTINTISVPEPSSLAILGSIVAAGLLGRRKRRLTGEKVRGF